MTVLGCRVSAARVTAAAPGRQSAPAGPCWQVPRKPEPARPPQDWVHTAALRRRAIGREAKRRGAREIALCRVGGRFSLVTGTLFACQGDGAADAVGADAGELEGVEPAAARPWRLRRWLAVGWGFGVWFRLSVLVLSVCAEPRMPGLRFRSRTALLSLSSTARHLRLRREAYGHIQYANRPGLQ